MAACDTAQTTSVKKTDWEKDGLKGKVKSVKETIYEAVKENGEINKGNKEDLGNNLVEYDDKGNKIELIMYKSDGNLDYKFTYEYDDKGSIIEGNSYNSDGSLDMKYT
jgi:hypothetical protein